MTTMTPFQFGRDLPPVPIEVLPTLKGELRVINTINTPEGEGFGSYSSSSRRDHVGSSRPRPKPAVDYCNQHEAQRQGKIFSCNVACASSRDENWHRFPPRFKRRESCIRYRAGCPAYGRISVWPAVLEKYDEVAASSSKSVKEATKKFTKQPMEKQKEFR